MKWTPQKASFMKPGNIRQHPPGDGYCHQVPQEALQGRAVPTGPCSSSKVQFWRGHAKLESSLVNAARMYIIIFLLLIVSIVLIIVTILTIHPTAQACTPRATLEMLLSRHGQRSLAHEASPCQECPDVSLVRQCSSQMQLLYRKTFSA